MTRKKTSARGLGYHHQVRREHLLASHTQGTPCWWCGKPMYREAEANWDKQPLHADHSVARANGGLHADRLLHGSCNAKRGKGAQDHLRPTLADKDGVVRSVESGLWTRQWF
ncbi:hypothetical protein [Rhodococcus gordoniae]|uniref:hypothetical protein n=1 Tax=Rhodococcus gordoniae TaxID=223392 RepID=UPI0020CE1D53|nr:hypothetical protein [Rhodococcus gordoniae]UTT48849.1 hypothetical protein NMQ04_01085 [Rhodococcus gordoniae]